MPHVTLAIATLTLMLSASARGQGNSAASDSVPAHSPLARGNHVRVAVQGDTAVLVGHIIDIERNRATVAPDDSGSPPRTIDLAALTRLEVRRDERLRTTSAQVGAGLGTLGAAALYYLRWCRTDELACAREQRTADAYTRHDQTYIGTGTVFAIGGMLAGGLVGYLLAPAPHWKIVTASVIERDAENNAHAVLRVGLEKRLLGR